VYSHRWPPRTLECRKRLYFYCVAFYSLHLNKQHFSILVCMIVAKRRVALHEEAVGVSIFTREHKRRRGHCGALLARVEAPLEERHLRGMGLEARGLAPLVARF